MDDRPAKRFRLCENKEGEYVLKQIDRCEPQNAQANEITQRDENIIDFDD